MNINNIQEQPQRELIAFAFVEEEYSRTGDIVRGLMPLFSPLLARVPHRRFDPKSFARQVEDVYDIPMSPIVAEGLMPKLAEAGLLYRESEDSQTYRVTPAKEATIATDIAGIDTLISEFVEFAGKALAHVDLELEPKQLEEALFQRFTSMQFLSFLERPDKNYFRGRTLTLKEPEEEGPEEISADQALDVLCAEYALRLSETDTTKFDILCKIASGALIAEVVLTLQSPSSARELADFTLFLDGPLVLDLFDLSTPELKEFASDLFGLIDRSGIKKAIFQHTVDEMRGTIHAPLDALGRGEEPYGPLGSRIVRDARHTAYARAALSGLETLLEEKGIEIVDAGIYLTQSHQEYCSTELEESLRNNLGPLHHNLERRARDALSVATILRLRGARRHPESITEAGWVFVTRNDTLAARCRQYLVFKKRLDAREIPPAMTDRQIAGILWFAVGGNLGVLSKKKLIANCSFVVHPRMDIVSKMRQCLTEMDPEKARIFSVLMRDQRAQRALVHATLGFPSVITPDNADEMFQEVRRSAATEQRRAAQEREQELQQEFNLKLDEVSSEHKQEILGKDTEILRLREQHKALEASIQQQARDHVSELSGINQRLDAMQQQYERDVQARVKRAERSANVTKWWCQTAIVGLYGVLVTASYLLTPGRQWIGASVAAVLALAGFWIVPHWLFEPILRRLWTKRFKSKALELHVSDKLDQFDLDPRHGRAVRKNM